ncbi:biotin--[acetyl-CoA-carboxylase] ligase [Streptomyces marispadix]|uniref:biotin--[biotin carboxyl-carrier protein] ligase n=1 Tax=Streptomyces marispadix TaxID=2922868 RepID=A0ABS9T160_9ACTN|nr:biotin--[acetyl-CoA-carboxylase] ligase [Streptomyces marispadix]MCH6162250.1 biotin--[acetyl-CoA-carboxylase] ligase [Streptomyces marispadix]
MTPNPSGNPGSRWSDLDRPPLNAASLRRALTGADSMWTSLDVVESTGSTNTDLASRAREGGAREGAVLVAEEQTAGRGRLERGWSAPARSGIFVSMLIVPRVPQQRWGWVPLLAGVATATALSRTAGVDTKLKWPNDVLVDVRGEERKTGGILAERTDVASEDAGGAAGGGAAGGGAGIVLGIGLNVTLREQELPVPAAGSLVLAGAREADRDPLLRSVLRSVEDWYGRWTAADGDPLSAGLLEAYAAGCVTLGRRVRAELPGGERLVGEAVAVDSDGRLVIGTESGVQRPVAAGDIVHLRGDRGDGADGGPEGGSTESGPDDDGPDEGGPEESGPDGGARQ